MAGRDLGKLERIKAELPDAKDVPLLKASMGLRNHVAQVDVKNDQELQEVAKKAKVILNFAGTPYADKAGMNFHAKH